MSLSEGEDAGFDVLGVGAVALDTILTLEAYPAVGSSVPILKRRMRLGGVTANALRAAARWGMRCAYAGVLGTDRRSETVLRGLSRAGIDTRFVTRRAGARPVEATVIVSRTEAARTILFGLEGVIGPDPALPWEPIAAALVVLLDNLGASASARIARLAGAEGIATVVDVEGTPDLWSPEVHELANAASHLVVGRRAAEGLSGESEPDAAALALLDPARAAVVVTDGAAGCWAAVPGQPLVHQPAFAVRVEDTTGCGDVFRGVYAATLAGGLPLEQRLRFASVAAGLHASGIRFPPRARVLARIRDSG